MHSNSQYPEQLLPPLAGWACYKRTKWLLVSESKKQIPFGCKVFFRQLIKLKALL